jgi:hypothetical protein
MAPIELDVLSAVEAVEALAAVSNGAVGARVDPAALVGVYRVGDSFAKIYQTLLASLWTGHRRDASCRSALWPPSMGRRQIPIDSP